MSAQQGASLASAGVNAASGNYAKAAVDLVAAFAGGGKKTPSVLQGFEISGDVSSSGFAGSIVAFDQKGNRWADGADHVEALSGGFRDAFAAAGIQTKKGTPINVRVDSNFWDTWREWINQFVFSSFSDGDPMQAASINSAKPAPAVAGAEGSTGAALVFGRVEQIVTLVAVVAGLFWALREVKS